jgi:hypothetical protein
LLCGESFEYPQGLVGVVKLDDLCAVLDQRKTVPSCAGADFQDFLFTQVGNGEEIPEDPIRVRIYFFDVLFFPPESFPMVKSGFLAVLSWRDGPA